jgi:hypothetical protein
MVRSASTARDVIESSGVNTLTTKQSASMARMPYTWRLEWYVIVNGQAAGMATLANMRLTTSGMPSPSRLHCLT